MTHRKPTHLTEKDKLDLWLYCSYEDFVKWLRERFGDEYVEGPHDN